MKLLQEYCLFTICLLFIAISACREKTKTPDADSIKAIALKQGELILCGPPGKQFGSVGFTTSCTEKVKKDFDLAVALLHSFEYDEAEKVFAKIINEEPECAMAYWGVAMSNYHPLWAPPTPAELEKGAKAIAIAQSISEKSARETAYINAIASFYKDWAKTDHRSRCLHFETAMDQMRVNYPQDKEAAIFYALTLTGAADPTDKTFSKQKKAVEILNALYPNEPNHPGIIHYIIHSYDNPALAHLALDAARKYASVAPSSAHAQHMPSHIFTRLGLWDEDIRSNLIAAEAAKCYGENTGVKGHWDEELHAMDYLVYSYLQKADNRSAKEQYDYLQTIQEVHPANFKVAYAYAAIPARYVLENKNWTEAANLQLHPIQFDWGNYPWQKSIYHFARLLGSVHTGNLNAARIELTAINAMYDTLVKQKDMYKANQVEIQQKSGEAWILFKEGKNEEALQLMTMAATMEDNTQKHSVTPGEVIPARELLGDMLLQMNRPADALEAYKADLKEHANRFNGLYGAAMAAERSGNQEQAGIYFQQLTAIANSPNSTRPELEAAKRYLQTKKK